MPELTPRVAAALIAAAVGAYLAGSVNFSLIAARLLGHGDLRRHGSGNAGATNLARVAGKGAAAAVLVLDIARGTAVVVAARALGLGAVAPLAAIPLLLGNMFPVFHGLRGGKGVAAAVGAALAFSPLTVIAGGAAFFAVFAGTRIVSLGSLVMSATYPLSAWLLGDDGFEVATAGALATLLIFSHRGNLARLRAGAEPRFGPPPPPPEVGP